MMDEMSGSGAKHNFFFEAKLDQLTQTQHHHHH